MRPGFQSMFLALFAGLALSVGSASAQGPETIPFQPVQPAASAMGLYGEAEYLLWWFKDAPLRIPLVITGPLEVEDKGVSSSLATVLYGGPSQGFQAASGLRLTLGAWLDDDQTFGFEGRGFLLERRTAGFAIHSDANGSPLIQVPFYSTGPAGTSSPTPSENGFPFAFANGLAGGVTITNTLQLWGADATAVIHFARGPGWDLSGLAGFTYLDLYEKFQLQGDVSGVATPFRDETGTLMDRFQTRNQFYGGTLGVRTAYRIGAFAVEASSRVSLGTSHQVLNVAGAFQATNYVTSSGPEGIFAQPSNEGRHVKDDFAVVPEAQLKLAYCPADWMRLTVGYNFLYDSSVVRPGDQLDRNLPKGQTFLQGQSGGQTISTTDPAPLFHRTDFYAHGLSFGLEFWY